MKFAYLLTLSMLLASPAYSASIGTLYGGNGGHPNPDGSPLSINNGWLVIIDQNTGAVTPDGHPAGVTKLSGLAFASDGTLYGSTLSRVDFPPPVVTSPTSHLISINPITGATINDFGSISAGGVPLQIADLAMQPGTNTLFGVSASSSGDFSAAGNLYTINTTTGVAVKVGNTGNFFNAIAFGPNGKLYATTADLDNMGNLVNTQLKTLNPLNASTLTAVAILQVPGALAVRADGVIFEGNGDAGGIYTINPVNGAETLVGNTGLNFVGDLAFKPIPEPASMALCGLGLLLLLAAPRRRGA